MNEPLLLRRGDIEGSIEYARKNIVFDPHGRYTLANLRDHDLRNGNLDEVLARYDAAFPGLATETQASVNEDSLQIAIDVAPVLLRMGQLERGNRLLDDSLQVIAAAASPESPSDFGIQRVLIYALKGDADAALDALRQTIDAGLQSGWWMYLEIDSSLDSIRDEPGFQSILQEVRDDMAAQRQRIEEWDSAGKLEPVTDPG